MTRVATGLRGFGRFAWDFIVGDDWKIAAGVIVALAVTAAVSTTSVAVWWVVPVAVLGLLGLSLWRATQARS
jgi:hypothetical protein